MCPPRVNPADAYMDWIGACAGQCDVMEHVSARDAAGDVPATFRERNPTWKPTALFENWREHLARTKGPPATGMQLPCPSRRIARLVQPRFCVCSHVALRAADAYQAVHAEEAQALGRESAGFPSLALQCLVRCVPARALQRLLLLRSVCGGRAGCVARCCLVVCVGGRGAHKCFVSEPSSSTVDQR